MYSNSKMIALLLVLFSVTISESACRSKSKPDQIDALVKKFYEKGAFNGAILVAEKGEVLYDTAMGYSDLQTRQSFEDDPAFYLASLSKQFTAMGILLLEQQYKLSLTDKLSKYFPGLPAYAGQISIQNLLNHTSGLKDYFESDTLVQPGLTNEQVLHWLTNQQTLNFLPGEKYAYSNTGYVLLSLIIEKVSGKTFAAFMKEAIFDPVHMTHTQVCDSSVLGIVHKTKGFDKQGNADDYNILTSGDGGIFSTTHDLFRWDQSLYKRQLAHDPLLKAAFSRPILNNGTLSEYGLGWIIEEEGKEKVVYHTGELNGYQTIIWRDLDRQITIIVLTNRGSSFQMWPVTNGVLKILGAKRYIKT